MGLVWTPNPGAQARAWSAQQVDELLFAGGRGSGKTSVLLGCYGSQVPSYGKSCKGLVVRQSFPELAELESQAIEMFVDTNLATYNIAKRIFTFMNGATLELGFLSKMKDYSRYHGRAFSYIGIDEINEYASWEMITKLKSCLRSKDARVKPIFRATGNPGGRLHNETYDYFVSHAEKGDVVIRNKQGKTRMYVHSTVKDNPYLFRDGDSDYVKWLKSLPEALYKAWYEGCWDIAIGAMFADVFDRDKHVIDRITPADIPEHIPRKRAHDWGQASPSCTLWYFISDGNELLNGMWFPKGAIVFYKELYTGKKDNNMYVGMGYNMHELGERILKEEMRDGDHPFVKPGPADNQIHSVGASGAGIGEVFDQVGVGFGRSIKDSGSNIVGWDLIRTRLKGKNRKPLMYFTKDCFHTARTLPKLIRDEVHIEDLAKNQEDHCADVVKYVVLDEDIQVDERGRRNIRARARAMKDRKPKPERYKS